MVQNEKLFPKVKKKGLVNFYLVIIIIYNRLTNLKESSPNT